MAMTARRIPEVHVHSRHRNDCKYKDKGSAFNRCACPKQLVWSENGTLKREAAQTFDWQEAEQKAQEKHESFRRVADGEPEPLKADEKTLEEAIDLFLAAKQGKEITGKHVAKLRTELNPYAKLNGDDPNRKVKQPTGFLQWMNGQGIVYLRDIKTEHILNYRNQLQGAQNTRAKKVFRLIGFFEFCVEMGWIVRNIARAEAIVIPYDDSQKPKALSDAHFEQLLASVPKVNGKTTDEQRKKLRGLLLLMRWTGLAIRDAVTIERSRFEQNGNGLYRLLLRRAKTNHPVYCTLMADIAEEVLSSSPETNRYVFINSVPEGERELDNLIQQWGNFFRKLSDVADLKNTEGQAIEFTSHWMRHTFVKWCLNSGLPTEDIAMLIGDTVQIVAKHYSDWIEERQERLTQRMSEALKQAVIDQSKQQQEPEKKQPLSEKPNGSAAAVSAGA